LYGVVLPKILKAKTSMLPVHKNKHYTTTITDLGKKGEGVGKLHDGFTLFVNRAIPGDEIEARVIKVKKNYGYGKLISIINPSKDRVEPPCPYVKRCGGCQIQQLDYAPQLAFKTNKVRESLKRIGKLEGIPVRDCLGMAEPFFYRNKLQFAVGQGKIGLYAVNSHDIVDIEKCYIQHPDTDAMILAVRRFLDEKKISIYDELKHEGLVRHLVARYSFSQQKMMVVLVINGDDLPESDEFVRRLSELPVVGGVFLNHNTKAGDTVLGDRVTRIWGEPFLLEKIGDIEFEISPLSFFQVNPAQTEILYDKVMTYAGLTGSQTVWDVHCGVGSISLFLAKKAKEVFGVDIVDAAIDDARRNAARNGIQNAKFFVGDAEKIVSNGPAADVVVLDPPRKGCDESLLRAVAAMAPKRIVYVSCDPVTLARDLQILDQLGHKTREIQPVDMFPHTVHVEAVAKLEKV
jgi:23S rRNA (uracil1939-C5)-methyltransferase